MERGKVNIKRAGILITVLFLISTTTGSVVAWHSYFDTATIDAYQPHVQPYEEYIMTFDITFSELNITEVVIDDILYHEITLDDCPIENKVGCPLLPVKPIDILLPQKGVIKSIDVEHGTCIAYGTNYNVQLGNTPAIPGYDYEPDNSINFDPAIPYPTEEFQEISINYFRGYGILTLVLNPVYYTADTGSINFYDEWSITITTSLTGTVDQFFSGTYRDELELDEDVLMYEDVLSTYTTLPEYEPDEFVEGGYTYDYVIITSESLKNAQGEYTFQTLKEFKESRGTSTAIVTVQEIYSYYEGRDNPEKIRNFIIAAYNVWKSRYILLGGDSDVVPVRKLFVNLNVPDSNNRFIPSDLYYACLGGSFNSDGDSYWGEPTDGSDIPDNPYGNDIDLMAEITVGRASIDDAQQLSNFVYKTIQYSNIDVTDEYLEDVLQVGELLWILPPTFGAFYMNELIGWCFRNGYITKGIPSSKYNIDKLYDLHGFWVKEELIEKINNNVHIINHVGHANYDNNMRLEISDVQSLSNNKFCFIYSQGCMAGGFDNPEWYDCIAEHFTVKTSHGAFAGIWNTRYGIGDPGGTDGPSQHLHREFWNAIFRDNLFEIGRAHQKSIQKNIYLKDHLENRYCIYEITLFGDPQIRIKVPDEPNDWITPDNHCDPESAWKQEILSYDYGTDTKADCLIEDFGWIWTPWLELMLEEPMNCNKIRFYAWYHQFHCRNIDVDLFYDGSWHGLYQGSFANWQWVEKSFNEQVVSKARVRFEVQRWLLSAVKADLYEFQFYPVFS